MRRPRRRASSAPRSRRPRTARTLRRGSRDPRRSRDKSEAVQWSPRCPSVRDPRCDSAHRRHPPDDARRRARALAREGCDCGSCGSRVTSDAATGAGGQREPTLPSHAGSATGVGACRRTYAESVGACRPAAVRGSQTLLRVSGHADPRTLKASGHADPPIGIGAALTFSREGRAPATPPGVRVRTRRFEEMRAQPASMMSPMLTNRLLGHACLNASHAASACQRPASFEAWNARSVYAPSFTRPS